MRKHSPNSLNLCHPCLRQSPILWRKLQATVYYLDVSCSYPFISLSLEERHHVNTQLEKNTFRLPFVKRLSGDRRQGKRIYKQTVRARSIAPAPFTSHNPNPGEKSRMPPLTSKTCSFKPSVKRMIFFVTTQWQSPHTFPRGNSAGFFPH